MLTSLSTTAPDDLKKSDAKEETAAWVEELAELQNRLYASGSHSVLILLQGMDSSGKDGVVRKVFGKINPQGVRVQSFKAPSKEELAHDFLWRIHRHSAERGFIQIHNRSHYEDVLVTRVHNWCDDTTAHKRFEAINAFEKLLVEHNNTLLFKFYLHISPEEQQGRLQERLTDPAKHWKHNPADLEEAKLWPRYMQMYEDVFQHCNDQPWTLVPADQNWYKEWLIAKTVVERLRALDLQYPALKGES